MDNVNFAAKTEEEVESQLDEAVAELDAEEKALLEEAMWPEGPEGTTFLEGLRKFLKNNCDGSEAGNDNMKDLIKRHAHAVQQAVSSGDEKNLKFLEVVNKLRIFPLDLVPPKDEKKQAVDESERQEQNKTPNSDVRVAEQLQKKKENLRDRDVLKKKLDEIVESVPEGGKYLLEKYETKWRGSDKQWKEGFVEYLLSSRRDPVNVLKDEINLIEKELTNARENHDEDGEKICKAELDVMKKLKLAFTNETEKGTVEADKNEMDKIKDLFSWKSIKRFILGVRDSIGQLLGFTPAEKDKGMEELEARATKKQTAAEKVGLPNILGRT